MGPTPRAAEGRADPEPTVAGGARREARGRAFRGPACPKQQLAPRAVPLAQHGLHEEPGAEVSSRAGCGLEAGHPRPAAVTAPVETRGFVTVRPLRGNHMRPGDERELCAVCSRAAGSREVPARVGAAPPPGSDGDAW